MTIKKSLILSHIVMCILPFLMTLVVLVTTLFGLYLYACSGNHIMAESDFQFHVESNVIQTSVFHSLRHKRNLYGYNGYQWVRDIMDPLQTYVMVYRDGQPFYQYGNGLFQNEVEQFRKGQAQKGMDLSNLNQTFSYTHMGHYEYLKRETVGSHVYHLYVIARHPIERSDAAMERAFRNTNRFVGLSLLAFILLVSICLTRLIIRRILTPLQALKKGSEEIQKGNLDIQIPYTRNDEFIPAIRAFNLMTGKLGESLRQREADEEKRKELIASISHDIRTPLTSIKAYVEGLLDHVATTPERQERYLRVIQKKTGVLERLIEQLFLLSKMELGEKVLPLEVLDLGEMVRGYMGENQLDWEKKGGHVELIAPCPVFVAGNKLLLERVLGNLISNSIKYKTADIVQIQITVAAKENQAVLTVEDDGPGVVPEALTRLTDIFYRTDKARGCTDNGSGLGLAIVNRAVRLMQGTIAFANRTPHGLAAVITLPLEKNHE